MPPRKHGPVEIPSGCPEQITHEDREYRHATEVARECGLYGLRRSELAMKLDMSLADLSRDLGILKAYSAGLADHAFNSLRAIYNRAMAGEWKALEFIALKHLNRAQEHDETADLDQLRHLASLPAEERRKRIRELTAKLQVAG